MVYDKKQYGESNARKEYGQVLMFPRATRGQTNIMYNQAQDMLQAKWFTCIYILLRESSRSRVRRGTKWDVTFQNCNFGFRKMKFTVVTRAAVPMQTEKRACVALPNRAVCLDHSRGVEFFGSADSFKLPE